jgi:hypothetical protein
MALVASPSARAWSAVGAVAALGAVAKLGLQVVVLVLEGVDQFVGQGGAGLLGGEVAGEEHGLVAGLVVAGKLGVEQVEGASFVVVAGRDPAERLEENPVGAGDPGRDVGGLLGLDLRQHLWSVEDHGAHRGPGPELAGGLDLAEHAGD